ncbi:hypothetical protein KI688_009154 [Linnemannia hyalina]|uniref:Uncharacterized protein n=1 Tax=Linnemannia hyalina TaxID=64524 RepID=A0A9P7XYH2_9FUNG|nr:hypothetical protein KI688_009154 [Linnemannia hyalina]
MSTVTTHYHPCEVQHLPHTNSADVAVSSNTTVLYESEFPSSADQDTCETPLPLAHTPDSDSDSTTSSRSSSSSSTRKTSKHHKHRRSHHSSSSSMSASFVVPGNVKRQGDIAINNILSRLQKRQGAFAILSTTLYSNNGYDEHYDDDGNDSTENDGGDNNEEGEDEEGAFRAVHHQGLSPELLRETLGPHALRQHHGNANLRHS